MFELNPEWLTAISAVFGVFTTIFFVGKALFQLITPDFEVSIHPQVSFSGNDKTVVLITIKPLALVI